MKTATLRSALEVEFELRRQIVALLEPPPEESASQWCEGVCDGGGPRLWIPAGQASAPGPFSFAGREYSRVIVDFFSDPILTDIAACFGSQLGKTVALMAGLASKMAREAIAAIWAMPNIGLGRSWSRQRWMPFIEASAGVNELIPRGAKRHDWSMLEQRLGASLLNIIGSNSAANLSSRPAPVAIADEVDKFNEGTKREADAIDLLDQRTKDFANPKRAKTSTPTITSGPIWQEFLKGNQCRRFVPCPHCKKTVVLVWSKAFTIFKLTGQEAFIEWDKEARTPKGRGWEGIGWDLDRVEKSARALCWNCGGHILDGHKTQMDRDGLWIPGNPNAPARYLSLQLPSLYASSPETRFGKLAVRFLQKKHSLSGLQGFINGDLAEPFEGQDIAVERIEIVSPADAQPIGPKTVRMMAADHQQTGARLPWVAREFTLGGHSRLTAFGFCETFDQLREVQLYLGIHDINVGIDSGDQATTIYRECLRFGEMKQFPNADVPEWLGWFPMKGREKRAFWKNAKSGHRELFGVIPADGYPQFKLPLLEFNGHHLKDILERLRHGKTTVRWELVEGIEPITLPGGTVVYRSVNAEYFKHMDGEILKPVINPRTRRIEHEWDKRTRDWPIDIKDCEVMIEAMAMRLGVLALESENQTEEKSR